MLEQQWVRSFTKPLYTLKKRNLDVVVLSDLHLGTYGCHAKEIVNYLQSISPRLLILNLSLIH
ncbi:MAG: hypothetical protein ABL876_12330, partial [Chitinophagaceae bacterium]